MRSRMLYWPQYWPFIYTTHRAVSWYMTSRPSARLDSMLSLMRVLSQSCPDWRSRKLWYSV